MPDARVRRAHFFACFTEKVTKRRGTAEAGKQHGTLQKIQKQTTTCRHPTPPTNQAHTDRFQSCLRLVQLN